VKFTYLLEIKYSVLKYSMVAILKKSKMTTGNGPTKECCLYYLGPRLHVIYNQFIILLWLPVS